LNEPLVIGIVSDVVCPWCYIGKRRLERAIEEVRRQHPGFAARLQWHPFFLNPDSPAEGEPYHPYLERKFGGPAQVAALFDRVRAAGRGVGIDFAFERIALRANTLKAHRLIHRAQAAGDAGPLVERLFAAQFLQGQHVGDPAVLARIAGYCGFDSREMRAYLDSAEDEDLVQATERQFRRMGVTAVPTFLFAGQTLTGAQDPAVMAGEILKALPAA
jgi:predicted DsbA family dithiol-disulfide isomerase